MAENQDVNMPKIFKNSDITVIRPSGCLNATNAWEFERDLTALLTTAPRTMLLVDLALVESIDSAGLMALVSGFKLADSLGWSWRLGDVSPAVKILLELTQLDKVFAKSASVR
jgi:anti-sigma B factor antagonist